MTSADRRHSAVILAVVILTLLGTFSLVLRFAILIVCGWLVWRRYARRLGIVRA